MHDSVHRRVAWLVFNVNILLFRAYSEPHYSPQNKQKGHVKLLQPLFAKRAEARVSGWTSPCGNGGRLFALLMKRRAISAGGRHGDSGPLGPSAKREADVRDFCVFLCVQWTPSE